MVSFELWMLLLATLLGLAHILAASSALTAQVGVEYNVSARDESVERKGVAGRLQRAQINFFETFPLFAAAVLIAATTDRFGLISQVGSGLYLAGRLVYVPLYALGVPWWRSIVWSIATLGVVMVVVQISL